MIASWQDNEQLVDLLVKEATEGLTPGESAQLALLSASLSESERASLDETAAAIAIAAGGAREPMPAALRAEILNSAPVGATRNAQRHSNAGWWAAAACLILAVAGWWPRLIGESAGRAQQVALTPQQQREALLASGRAMAASWSGGPAADKPIVGDVVFDPVSQQGFLRFRGISANDPRLAQYQLWIADSGRAQPEPVDGGVFNVAASPPNQTGEVIIPFRAKLPVGKPAAFVVTMEQPGGVVVSRQERVVALAKMGNQT